MRILRSGLLLPAFFALAAASVSGASQTLKVWVELRDKGPLALAGRAAEDAPVYKPYVGALRAAGLRPSVLLKWQNRVSGWIDADSLPSLSALPCVLRFEEMPRRLRTAALPKSSSKAAAPQKPLIGARTASVDFGRFAGLFDSIGVTALTDSVIARGQRPGAGLRIAQLDEDFHLGHHAFDSLFARNQIVDQWDFVSDTAVAVQRDFAESHGASVLSLLAANLPGTMIGAVPDARFLLYRTESEDTEAYFEEDYLAAGIERAVDSGAQIVNVSLGYRYDFTDGSPDHPYSDFDGRTRPSTIAVVGAARRGVLVVVAMGNEGAERLGQPTITAPADADSILSVGITDPAQRYCSYSSTGPSYDGRLKPELSSEGTDGCLTVTVNPASASGTEEQGGTSFAAPAVTGAASLLRQLNPDTSSQRIRLALMATSRDARDPDDFIGNGVLRGARAQDYLLGTFDSLPPVTKALKGVVTWRGGRLVVLPGPPGLQPGATRLWDFKGRSHPITVSQGQDEVDLVSGKRLAPGPYILKIPLKSSP